MPADTHFEPHSHAWAQLAYCATGVLQVTAEGGTAKAHGGEITYIVPPSRAVWIAPARSTTSPCWKPPSSARSTSTPAPRPGLERLPRAGGVAAAARIDHALDTSALDRPLDPTREQLLSGLVLDELTHADTQALGVPMPHPQTGDKRLRALCEAVLRAPAQRATLAEWAADTGASERTVARLFRDELGLSYQQWRQQAILAHALPLLTRGQPVSAVAAASGYASDSAFTAMFKAAMGQSPSHFQSKNGLVAL
jgi:AraC-like DNA-binding protein